MKADNTRLYVLAILGMAAIGVAGVVTLEVLRPDTDRGLIVSIFGFLGPTLVALLALIRGEANGQAIAKVADKVDVNTVVTIAAKEEIKDTVSTAMTDSAQAAAKGRLLLPNRNLPYGE